MTTVSFKIAIDDLNAFIRYSTRRMRKEALKMFVPLFGGLSLAVFLFLYWQSGSWGFSLFFAALVAAVCFLPSVNDGKRWREKIRKANVSSIAWALGPQNIVIDDKGIAIASQAGTLNLLWQSIDQLAITPTHAFLLSPYLHACIIPLRDIPEDERLPLLKELRTRIEKMPPGSRV